MPRFGRRATLNATLLQVVCTEFAQDRKPIFEASAIVLAPPRLALLLLVVGRDRLHAPADREGAKERKRRDRYQAGEGEKDAGGIADHRAHSAGLTRRVLAAAPWALYAILS